MKIVSFFLLLLLYACENKTELNESALYFDKEIARRIETLKNTVIAGDSMKTKSLLIDKEVSNLILLSKDIENMSASVNRANSFFDVLVSEFKLNIKDFTKLNTGMHVNEIELALKQNELNLFNQIIFKTTNSTSTMYTAQ